MRRSTTLRQTALTALGYGLILFGGVLFSAHLRLKIAIGAPLGEAYTAFPPGLFMLIAVCAAGAALVRRALDGRPRASADVTAALAGTAAMTAAMLVLLPDLSQLQIAYFAAGSAAIAVITLALTPGTVSLPEAIALLWRNHALLRLWVRYNVRSRYSQTILGILWIVLLPVATSIILTFVFSYIFRAGTIGDVPFVSFFLSGLMIWALFTQSILNSAVSIVGKLHLIGQIYFPREILVLVKLGEALVDFSFVFAVTLVINLLVGITPNANFVYLPLLLAVQLMLTLGIMLFTSYLTVLIRDLQPLITVFMQLLFYLTPLMYPVAILPPSLGELVKFLNPIAALVDAYRDVIVYNRPPDIESLYFPTVLAGVVLYCGYMFFKASEKKLADFR